MKTAAYLLITASLIIGVIGAVTAYSPRLDLPDDRLRTADPERPYLTLNAPAGDRSGGVGKPEPIAAKGDPLTPELLADLRAAGVARARVKEFGWSRWSGRWMFIAGSLGLFAGAMVVRRETRRAVAAAGAARSAAGAGPDESLAALRAGIDRLQRELPTMTDPHARLDAILGGLGDAQRTTIPAFIAAQPVLVARLGLAGYARLMDAFAAAERQINRAWSAAADGVEEEALTCLARARDLLTESAARVSR